MSLRKMLAALLALLLMMTSALAEIIYLYPTGTPTPDAPAPTPAPTRDEAPASTPRATPRVTAAPTAEATPEATVPAVVMPPQNTTRITLFHQDLYEGDDWALGGYAGRTLASSGCFLFSYAHAQQWLTGQADDEGLVRLLHDVCLDPNGHYSHSQCTHMPIDGPAFNAYSRSQGCPVAEDAPPAKGRDGLLSQEGLREFFSRGRRVLCLHGGGHHVLAVELAAFDGAEYVHIIDSHWGSIQDKGQKEYFYLQEGEMVSVAVDPAYYGYGCDYWMRAEDAAGYFKVIFAWKLNPEYTFTN